MSNLYEYTPRTGSLAGRRLIVEVGDDLPIVERPDLAYYNYLYDEGHLSVQEIGLDGGFLGDVVPDNMDLPKTWEKIAKRYGFQKIQNNPSI